jgi:protein tyrosine/serine phosphatase
MRSAPAAAVLIFFAAGCARYAAAPPRSAILPVGATKLYETLHSTAGPTRFSQVTTQLYRGGQPTETQLRLLYQLGVRTIVNLRNEGDDDRAAEERIAAQLGLRFLHFPFSGIMSPDPALLRRIVNAIQDQKDGAVYVHCHAGRDRTSLVVALYRVWVEGWSPNDAWQHEARDFGHSGLFFLRALDQTFQRLTAQSRRSLKSLSS